MKNETKPMKKLQKTTILLVSILFAACKNQTNYLDFEKEVIVEIFPNLMDSIWVASQINLTPPPVTFNEKSKVWTSGEKDLQELKRSFNLELNYLKKDSTKIFVEIFEENIPISKNEHNELIKHFKNIEIIKDENDTLKNRLDKTRINGYKNLNITYIKSNTKFTGRKVFIYHEIYGIVSISRIKFDKKKKFGVISIGVHRSSGGNDYRVFIKRIKNKWIIEHFEESRVDS